MALTGLTDAEAAARLTADGPNQLASGGREPLLAIVRDVLREPMLLFLIAAGLLYLLLGDAHEALILTAFAGLTIAIAVAQEVRSDRAIAALGELAMPQASLIRDGRRLAVAAREVVRGDLLVLEEGGRIVADGWIVSAHDLTIDEAVLTGESVPVAKAVAKDGSKGTIAPVPGGEVEPYAWAGTLVVRGTGLVEVAATGPRTAIGAIGQSLGALGKEPSRLAVQSRWLVRWFAISGLAVSALAVVLFALLRGSW
ncbi:MAG TPA: cation-transporting P-type ATPase, partial [Novosphingobium sp.]